MWHLRKMSKPFATLDDRHRAQRESPQGCVQRASIMDSPRTALVLVPNQNGNPVSGPFSQCNHWRYVVPVIMILYSTENRHILNYTWSGADQSANGVPRWFTKTYALQGAWRMPVHVYGKCRWRERDLARTWLNFITLHVDITNAKFGTLLC